MQKHANRVAYNLFEAIAIDKTQSFTEALQEAKNHCCEADFGIELDMDSIELMGSSAMTSSGFSMSEARAFLAYFSKHPHLKYIHICEGAPKFGVFENQVGKAIAYLVSDVIAED